MKRRAAFTLIELLIVISILIIIVGLVVANFRGNNHAGPMVTVPVATPAPSQSRQNVERVERNDPMAEVQLVCESIEIEQWVAQGRDIQTVILNWQRQHPSARIVSIVAVQKNEAAIGALVITAYAPR